MCKPFLCASFLALAACTTPAAQTQRPVISTGVESDGIYAVLGIEYARADRWALPEVNADWDAKSDFSQMGPACPQDGQTVMVEYCLFLNVFTPDVVTNDTMPVIVWFHGGGFREGQGGDGPKWMIPGEDIIVVTFNYRLGKLGFHDWAGWDEDDPRNFGQADMVAALDWVQDNISRFGGDPDNVTLAGHSAGGMGVQLMMVDPRARGKFARAFSHAGYGAWPFPKAYNPTPEERARIRYRPLETERSAADLVADVPYFHLPYIDAPFLRDQPIDMFLSGDVADTSYVAGANSMDGAGTLQGAGYTPEGFLAKIDSPAIRAAYADDFAISDRQAAERIFGDLRYLRSSFLSAEAVEGYAFYYDARRDTAPGAYHGDHYAQMFNPDDFAMKDALLDFARTGDPGWEDVSSGTLAVFDPDLKTVDLDLFAAKRSALEDAVKALP